MELLQLLLLLKALWGVGDPGLPELVTVPLQEPCRQGRLGGGRGARYTAVVYLQVFGRGWAGVAKLTRVDLNAAGLAAVTPGDETGLGGARL